MLLAPSRVPLFNITNKNDLGVPDSEAVLNNAWQTLVKIFPDAVSLGHDPTSAGELQRRVVRALLAGNILSPNVTDRLVVPFPANIERNKIITLAEPSFAGGSAPNWTAEINPNVSIRVPIIGDRAGESSNWQGRAFLCIGAPTNLSAGLHNLSVNTSAIAFPTDTEANAVLYDSAAFPTPSKPCIMASIDIEEVVDLDEFRLTVAIADTQPVVDKSIQAVLIVGGGPPLTPDIITLFDDGAHRDGAANDGVYSNVFLGIVRPVGNMEIHITINPPVTGVSTLGAPSIQQQTEIVLPIRRVPNPNPPADLFITATGPSTAPAGSTVEYNLTFGNKGPASASDVFIGLKLPDGVTYVSDTIGGQTGETALGRIWILGTLGVGSQQTATLEQTGSRTARLSLFIPPTVPPGTALTTALTIQATNPADPHFGNNIAAVTTQVTQQQRPPQVPTLSEWGLVLLIVAVGAVLAYRLRRLLRPSQ